MTDQELKDLVAGLAVAQAKTDAQMAKTNEQMARTDKKLASMLEMLDGITTAEEFFFNTLADSLTVGGVKYDGITSNIRRKINGQWVEVDLIVDSQGMRAF